MSETLSIPEYRKYRKLRNKFKRGVGANKYGAQAIVVDGIRFHSTKEARRWQELQTLEAYQKIAGLRRQVRYPLRIVTGDVLTHYVADFVYVENGVEVVEDTKGFRTNEYKRKREWMRLEHGIIIYET